MPFKGLMFVIGFATMIQSAFAANGGVRYNLPQFGLYMDGYGQVLERAPDGNDEMWWRPVTDLISEWKSQYLVREPKEEETDEMQSTWRAKNFVAIDCETTGLKIGGNDIIELAAVKFVDFKPVEKYHTYLKPRNPIPADATGCSCHA